MSVSCRGVGETSDETSKPKPLLKFNLGRIAREFDEFSKIVLEGFRGEFQDYFVGSSTHLFALKRRHLSRTDCLPDRNYRPSSNSAFRFKIVKKEKSFDAMNVASCLTIPSSGFVRRANSKIALTALPNKIASRFAALMFRVKRNNTRELIRLNRQPPPITITLGPRVLRQNSKFARPTITKSLDCVQPRTSLSFDQ